MHLLLLILDVGVNQQRIGLAVNVFHCNLETIEASCLGRLDLSGKVTCKILVYYSVRGCKEGQNTREEVSFIICQPIPILMINREIGNQKEASACLYICHIYEFDIRRSYIILQNRTTQEMSIHSRRSVLWGTEQSDWSSLLTMDSSLVLLLVLMSVSDATDTS